jgi:hypothetical protein
MKIITGFDIRVDSEGDGHYGASRGTRVHKGVDYYCKEGTEIRAPFNMIITRVSKPKTHSEMSGIAWQKGKSTGRMFYFQPDKNLIGKSVYKGDVIGIAQSVSRDYGLPNMNDHIHFQVNK